MWVWLIWLRICIIMMICGNPFCHVVPGNARKKVKVIKKRMGRTEFMSCPECHEGVNIMPSARQDEIKVVDMHRSKKYNIRVGVYHLDCYRKIKEIHGHPGNTTIKDGVGDGGVVG